MPSLFKYFTIVGGVLLGLLMLANSILEPGGLGPSMVKATPKVIVKHDPRASLVERLRAEEAAQKAAAPPVTVAEPTPVTQRTEPVRPPAAPAQAEPAQVSAPATVRTATPTEDASARAVRIERKKIKAERVRKQRLAQRARALEAASRQQGPAVPYGYAPQPTYGPFGWWGQAQR